MNKLSCSWGLSIKEIEMDTLFDSDTIINEINQRELRKNI